ncbi:MAG: dipeptidyl carboxypeptidase II, partial [Gammaproteobacteria bacterium]|nr:dipeptidyl carboxypeptidase II [Gammaproteobacteria bacterium]
MRNINLRITDLFCAVLALSGCTDSAEDIEIMNTSEEENLVSEQQVLEGNPFFVESTLYMNYPQFDLIKNEHYLPAFELGMDEHLAEVELIATQLEAPSFD